jgi:hypothetical protein
VLALAGVALFPRLGAAQSEDGWFDSGRAPNPQVTYSQQVTSSQGPGQPTPPPDPNRDPSRMEPLPESPLLSDGGGVTDLDRDPRALTAWNQELAPYGAWVDDPSYGRVWVPSPQVVGAGFSPYVTGGRWALDENNDWIWASDYPFGKVVFHYGRWVWIEGRGWAWVPGLEYAPAWVTWRVPVDSYAYVGWAPIPPSYLWFGGISVWWGYPYYYPWVFCPSAYVFYPHVHHYVVHDHDGQAHAAHHTRPYDTPRGYVKQPPRGPAPSAAQIPAASVPRERVSSREIAAAPAPSLGVPGPGARRDGAGRYAAGTRRDLTAAGAASRSTKAHVGSGKSVSGSTRVPSGSSPSLAPSSQGKRSVPPVPSVDRSELRAAPSLQRMSVPRSTPRMSAPVRSSFPSRMPAGGMRMPRR